MEEEEGSAGPSAPPESATERRAEEASDDDESDDEEDADDDGPEDEGLQIPVSHELVLEGALLLRSWFDSCTSKSRLRRATCSCSPVQAIERR